MNGQTIWNTKSQTFPKFINNNIETLNDLEFFTHNGVEFSNKTILDIGCGNGRFGLELAKLAKSLIGTDISDKMLAQFAHHTKELGLSNVQLHCCEWLDFPSQSFDIVFASMTPALNHKTAFLKALKSCVEYFCYIGWGKSRECPFLDQILRLHQLRLELPTGLPDVLKWLQEENYPTPIHQYRQSDFTFEGDFKQAFENIKWYIQIHGGIPNDELIKEYISSHLQNNKITYLQKREIGLALIPIIKL